jgi:hypothetical protein
MQVIPSAKRHKVLLRQPRIFNAKIEKRDSSPKDILCAWGRVGNTTPETTSNGTGHKSRAGQHVVKKSHSRNGKGQARENTPHSSSVLIVSRRSKLGRDHGHAVLPTWGLFVWLLALQWSEFGKGPSLVHLGMSVKVWRSLRFGH